MSDAAKDYAAGLAAGVATVVIGHPFDTVKVKLQKHNTDAHGVKYKNALHCTARILSSEGVRGLYRGATPSFVGMAFESSLLFGFYSQMKQSLQGEVHSSRPQLQVIIPSAACGGAIISFVLCPSELVKFWATVFPLDVAKTIIQTSPAATSTSNPFLTLNSIYRRVGLNGCYTGLGPTLVRAFPANAAAIVTWELTAKLLGVNHD